MEIKMSGNKDEKPKAVQLFHISHSLFKNKRLKRRLLAYKTKSKPVKKYTKPKSKPKPKNTVVKRVNGHPSPNLAALFSETIEIESTDDEQEQAEEKEPIRLLIDKPSELETSIVLSSDNEDEVATQARIFPMLTSETTVQTAVGNNIFELSLTQLKENLQTITKKRKKHKDSKRLSKRLKHSNLSGDLSISLLSDDEDGG